MKLIRKEAITSVSYLFQAINDAVKSGSVLNVMYALTMKAQANCHHPETMESPLHLAVYLRLPKIFGFLLLVKFKFKG